MYDANAFRILGLPVDASTRDATRRVSDIKQAHEDDDAASEHMSAFALDPPPDIETVNDAARKLQDAERRIIDEFFWFWPSKWGQGRNDPAFQALLDGDKQRAFDIWAAMERDKDANLRIVARHNLAVIYHFYALTYEMKVLERNRRDATLDRTAAYWKASFQRWEALADDDRLWSQMKDRVEQINDPRLTTGFVRRIRSSLPQALDKVNAELAICFAEKEQYEHAATHITYMKQTHQGLDNVSETLRKAAFPIMEQVRSYAEQARTQAADRPEDSAQLAMGLLRDVNGPFKTLSAIFDSDDHELMDLADHVADACLTCQSEHARKTEQWGASIQILEQVLWLPITDDFKAKIDERVLDARLNDGFVRFGKPLIELMDGIISSQDDAKSKLSSLKSVVSTHLDQVKREMGEYSDTYVNCCNAAASRIRSVSVAANNDENDTRSALEGTEFALTIAQNPELRDQLFEDKNTLESMLSDKEFFDALESIMEEHASDSSGWIALSFEALERSFKAKKRQSVVTRLSLLRKLRDTEVMYRVGDCRARLVNLVYAFRSVAIDLCNEKHEFELAIGALKDAGKLLGLISNLDPELTGVMQQLAKDEAQINELRKQKIWADLQPLIQIGGMIGLVLVIGVLAGAWEFMSSLFATSSSKSYQATSRPSAARSFSPSSAPVLNDSSTGGRTAVGYAAPKQSSARQTQEAQQLLTELGYNPGSIDGQYGQRTANAVKTFQRDKNLAQDGRIDRGLIDALRIAKTESDRTNSRPPPVETWNTKNTVADTALDQLSQRIDQEKASVKAMEADLASSKQMLDNLESELDRYKRDIDFYEAQARNGTEVNEFAYQAALDSYNGLVPRYNAQIQKSKSLFSEYESVVDQVNRDVATYNAQINR